MKVSRCMKKLGARLFQYLSVRAKEFEPTRIQYVHPREYVQNYLKNMSLFKSFSHFHTVLVSVMLL